MKNLFLLILFAAVNTGLFAADVPVRIMSSNKLIIVDKNQWKSPELDITIREANGSVLVHENIKRSTKYNLKHVPDGDYVLEIADHQKIKIQFLTIKNGSLLGKTVETIYKPVIRIHEDKLDFNLMAQGHKAVVTIRNTENQQAHAERITNEVSITRRFNLQDLEPGRYFIDVAVAGRIFTQEFDKK